MRYLNSPFCSLMILFCFLVGMDFSLCYSWHKYTGFLFFFFLQCSLCLISSLTSLESIIIFGKLWVKSTFLHSNTRVFHEHLLKSDSFIHYCDSLFCLLYPKDLSVLKSISGVTIWLVFVSALIQQNSVLMKITL